MEVLCCVGKSTLRRITSIKAGLVTSSKREFIVSSAQTELNGSIVFTTRSLTDDGKFPVKRGYTRGIINCAGFIIRPVQSGETKGCEIQFLISLDMKGMSGRANSSRVDALIKSLVDLTDSVRHGHSTKLIDNQLTIKHSLNASNAMAPNEQQQLKDISDRAVKNILRLFESESSNVLPNPWTSFYDADGIDVSECNHEVASVGTLRASCSMDANPTVIRRLLMDRAEAIDGLLEKRYVLSRLDSSTIVQLLAYGPIWPVGARDYLVVTSEVDYSHSLGQGFIIASTSIDDICEEEDAHQGSVCSKYTRSSMRLAGYVGTPNSSGGTDLKMFVDIDVYSYVPSWLVHILAQYGLSEMMNRIRLVSIGERVSIKPFQLDKIVNKLRDRGADTPQKVQRQVSIIIQKEERRKSIIDGIPSFAMAMAIEAETLEASRAGEQALNNNCDQSISDLDDDEIFEDTLDMPQGGVETPLLSSGLKTPFDAKGRAIADEAVRLHHLYLSGKSDTGDCLEWVEKVNRKGVVVSASAVNGSTWLAIQATTTISASLLTVRQFLLDDSNVGSYDDMFDTCDV